MTEVNITYETLFELLRREKTRESLQTLEPTFFEDVIKYLEEKKKFLEKQKNLQDLFADEERKKAVIQEENIRKIIKDLYERRERKIINMALDKSRTTSSVIDTSVLLKEERKMYEELLNIMDGYRKEILRKLLMAQRPVIEGADDPRPEPKPEPAPEIPADMPPDPDAKTEPEEKTKQEQTEEKTETTEPTELKATESKDSEPSTELKEPIENPQIQEPELIKIKFLKETAKFLGTDLKEHGPYQEGDEAELPPELTKILIGNGTAEKI